ncbi:Cna B-type domain-containing protein, partial [Acinetobacter baumannii]|uniref:Cna B-type domain-containing protein n=1 Tax=Acinetobacter baumannii TaxID=470 RepID=UPI001AED09D0
SNIKVETQIKITNRYRNEEKTKISGFVEWDDYSNKFLTRPNELTLNLYRDDQPTVVLDSIKITNGTNNNKWDYEFPEEYDAINNVTARPYIYRVEQVSDGGMFDSYQKEINGLDFFNTYEARAEVSFQGTIEWDDYQNKFETRPNEVTLY